jgi:Patatin-like phospholipase
MYGRKKLTLSMTDPPENAYLDQLSKRVNQQLAGQDLSSHLVKRSKLLHNHEGLPKQGHEIDGQDLTADPDLQQSMAFETGYTPSKWLLEQEAELVVERRLVYGPDGPTVDGSRHDPDKKTPGPPQPGEDIYAWAKDQKLTGICFSGGGIRSATFNLGILQGMASKDWLDQFDYLSSVSGGGYIHSWLTAWLKRKTKEFASATGAESSRDGWRHVMTRLVPLPQHAKGAPPQVVWPRQIQWLRRYSNYLTPRKGFLSGDTWASFAAWLRNVSLNQGLLIAIFLAVLAVPHLFAPGVHLGADHPAALQPSTVAATVSTITANGSKATLTLAIGPDRSVTAAGDGAWAAFGRDLKQYLAWDIVWQQPRRLPRVENVVSAMSGWSWAALLLITEAGIVIGLLLHLEYIRAFPSRRGSDPAAKFRRWQVTWVNLLVVLPLLLFGLALTHVSWAHPAGPWFTLKLFGLLLGLMWVETFAGGAIQHSVYVERERRRACSLPGEPNWWWKVRTAAWLAALAVTAAVAGTLVGTAIAALVKSIWMRSVARWLGLDSTASVQVVLGTLLFFWLPPLTMVLASGMIGKNFPDWLGEWLARIRGYTVLAGIGWIAFFGCSLLMPGAVSRAWPTGWIRWPAILTWAATTLGGALGGRSNQTNGEETSVSGPLEWIVNLGPYVYIAGLAVLLSLALELGQSLLSLELLPKNECPQQDFVLWLAVTAFFTGFAVLLGCRLDINQFSMHSFYRNRLTRCYLGASNENRNPSPITGFDEGDSSDLSIASLTPNEGYLGPIPIFCCTMNITTGEELAWQERKAASFAFTPLYSGYTVGWTEWRHGLSFNGFVPTPMLYPGGPNVATAMAASGAAMSPNWGYHTNPATAFLMTMFDVRLGLWVPNPRRSPAAGMPIAQAAGAAPCEIPPAGPRFAPWRLLSELLGSVDDTSKYVYLTDGGHFDNMGLYELVRRRCYRIVICDAEQDGSYKYEGIGASIRKCRIDFGVEINLDLSDLSPNTENKLSPAHIARGTIRYPETPAGDQYLGKVTYIKASLTARKPKPASHGTPLPAPASGCVTLPDVPGDVQNYKLQHAGFPHDPTADQWFTESQFESYRRLGERVIEGLERLFV